MLFLCLPIQVINSYLVSSLIHSHPIKSYRQSRIYQPNSLNCFTLYPSISPSIEPCSPEWNLSAPRVQWHSTTWLVSPPESIWAARCGEPGIPGIWSKLGDLNPLVDQTCWWKESNLCDKPVIIWTVADLGMMNQNWDFSPPMDGKWSMGGNAKNSPETLD